MHIAPYLSAFGLLAVIHAMQITRLRWRHKVSLGDGGILELQRKIRVFGNFSEFVPLGLILLLACELVQTPVWLLHFSGGALLLGRCLHAIGLGRTPGPSAPRVAGMLFTYLSFAISSVAVLVFSVYHPA